MKTSYANVVVVGAANIDIFAQSHRSVTEHDSNPGHIHVAHGGVGRNIAENLARLNLKPIFFTALAQDQDGLLIRQNLERLGAIVEAVAQAQSNRYVAMLDEVGEMVVAVADMASLDSLNERFLAKHQTVLSRANYLVLDANLAEATWSWLTAQVSSPIYADAISVSKAARLKPYRASIHTLKVNRFEASVLSECDQQASPETHVIALLNHGVKEVFLTLGEAGALHGTAEGIRHKRSPLSKVDIVNTTGAGDAFMSGVIYARHHHKDPLKYGLAMSSIALQSRDAVAKTLTADFLEHIVKESIL